MAKIVPTDEHREPEPLFGYMAGTAEIRGNIVQSMDVEWSALSGEEDLLYGELQPTSDEARCRPTRRKHK